jgi:hypothetical protein
MKLSFLIIISLLLSLNSSYAQLTEKDFKLCLDQLGCSDSVLKISKADLLKANKITPNFSWLTIKSLTIYVGQGNYTSEVMIINIKGDTINNQARYVFQKLKTGGFVTFEVEGYNKTNQRVPWSSLTVRIL